MAVSAYESLIPPEIMASVDLGGAIGGTGVSAGIALGGGQSAHNSPADVPPRYQMPVDHMVPPPGVADTLLPTIPPPMVGLSTLTPVEESLQSISRSVDIEMSDLDRLEHRLKNVLGTIEHIRAYRLRTYRVETPRNFQPTLPITRYPYPGYGYGGYGAYGYGYNYGRPW